MLRKLYAVYDADGSLSGELAYLLDKLAGVRTCALCDISHGWNPMGKKTWRATQHSATLGTFDVTWLHRDEQSPALSSFTEGQLPAVVLQLRDGFKIVLDKTDLAACNGDFEKFEAALLRKLQS